jgi:hypothetical protein
MTQVQSPQEESSDFNIQEELDKLWRQAEAKYSKNKKFKRLQEELFSIPDRDSLETLLGKVTKDGDQNLKDRRQSYVLPCPNSWRAILALRILSRERNPGSDRLRMVGCLCS